MNNDASKGGLRKPNSVKMSSNAYSRLPKPLKIAGYIVLLPALVYAGFTFVTYTFLGGMQQQQAKRESSNMVPQGLIEIRSESTGDFIDSPDHYGWLYEYSIDTEKTSPPKVFNDFQINLRNGGYAVNGVQYAVDGPVGTGIQKGNYRIEARHLEKKFTMEADLYASEKKLSVSIRKIK